MKKTKKIVILILALLIFIGNVIFQVGYCLSSNFHVYDDTVVYDIVGRGINVTITLDTPENKVINSTVNFSLKISEPYTLQGTTVNGSDYLLNVRSLDFYLISGVMLDYDRTKIIDTVWLNWANTTNTNYVEEEKLLFQNRFNVTFSKVGDIYYGKTILPQLSEGLHNVTVWIRAQQDQVTTFIPCWAAFSKTLTFKIDTINPKIKFLTVNNSTFEMSDVSLNFTVDEIFSKLEYSLNGKNNVTFNGNTTISGLSNGYHNITIYATDLAGNVGSSQTSFTVAKPEPESFPIFPVTASVGIVTIVSLSLLIYFKKHKR